MGGYGALKFALKRPDLFIFAGSMSGAFDAPRLTEINKGVDWDNLSPSISEVFGEENNAARIKNDLFEIIQQLPIEQIRSMPDIYIDCGTRDGFLKSNRRLAKRLKDSQITLRYDEVSGGHDWTYWDKQIRVILEIVSKIFDRV